MKGAFAPEPGDEFLPNTTRRYVFTEGSARVDSGDGRMIGSRRRVAETVAAPGEYQDGPVYLRVTVRAAGRHWPVPGFAREVNDHELENDDVHDWVLVGQNSRAAHAYREELVTEHGLPPRSVAVVRFRSTDHDRGA